MKRILITGPLGQDGILMTEILQEKYELYGICKTGTDFQRMTNHQKKYNIDLTVLDLTDYNQVSDLIVRIKPDFVINFAGETDVINPWSDIIETSKQNFTIPINLVQSLIKYNPNCFFFQSSSSLMYAKSNEEVVNEKSSFAPLYPYGITKLGAHSLLTEIRKNNLLECSSGIFFNHESYFRNTKFLSKKLSIFVSKILNGNKVEKLKLYNLNFFRDISHSKDFMRGVELIIENKMNEDFIFSSYNAINLLDFSKKFFTIYNLNFDDYVDYVDDGNYCNNYKIIGDNTKLKSIGWQPEFTVDELIKDMVEKELEKN